MAELNPPLGTTSPPVFLLNVQNLDKAMNSSDLTWNDRGDIERDSGRGYSKSFSMRLPYSHRVAAFWVLKLKQIYWLIRRNRRTP
ncbi:hypothetical protein F7P08_07115 [Klebsiella pneumoniae]|nr:hypothetical protein F7P08_07115 [Klebsiella pneumoniae]